MTNGDETFKLARQTPKERIEFNDDYLIPREGMQYENLNAIDKVYACCIDETWLHEQPQTTMFPIQRPPHHHNPTLVAKKQYPSIHNIMIEPCEFSNMTPHIFNMKQSTVVRM
jgi:hypothetical protein